MRESLRKLSPSIPGTGVAGSPACRRTTLALIFLSYLISSFLLFFLSVCLVGKRTLLHHAAQISPYSMIFAREIQVRDVDRGFRKLIFFFGDSSIVTVKGSTAQVRELRIPGMLEAEVNRQYPELGSTSVVEWAFVAAQPFHYYCMLFAAEKYSPSLIIAPINWRMINLEYGAKKERPKFHELSRLVPPSERFSRSADNPFVLENISLTDQFLYLFDKPKLYAQGLKLWSRASLSLLMHPATRDDNVRQMTASDPNVMFAPSVQNWRTIMEHWSDSTLFDQYPLDVTPENTQVRILHLIAETASKRRIPFLFYITPIHTHEMRRRETFDEAKLERSVRTVLEHATVGSTRCVNLIDLLDENEKHFIDFLEHYNVEGSRLVIRALAPEVRSMLVGSRQRPEP